MKKIIVCLLMVLTLALSACAYAEGNRSVTFDSESYVVYVGKQQRIIASVELIGEDAPKQTRLIWSSSDEKIVTVNANGTVTGISAGTADVRVCTADDESIGNSVTVEVREPVKGLSISLKEVTLCVGGAGDQSEVRLECAVSPENAFHQDVIWSSSNDKVATVDENGTVKAVAKGSAVITAAAADPTYNGKSVCKVTVTQAVTGITLDKETVVIPVGKSFLLKATVLPADAGSKQVEWNSSDESIAVVNANGQIRGVGAGNAVITASAKDGSGIKVTCPVKVVTPVRKISFESNKLSLPTELSSQLTAVIEPEDATVKELVWKSSNEKVATVDENGCVTGVGKGTANITASANDGSNVKASVSVKVDKYDLVFTTKYPKELTYNYGTGMYTITGSVKYGNVSIPTINTRMIVVGNGSDKVSVTPVRPGTDVITIKVGRKKYKFTVYVAPEAFD